MNVRFMQRVDFWVGVPLCFFVGIILRFTKLFSPRSSSSLVDPKKILLIELSEMGSAILAYPSMRRLQLRYPDAKLFFLVFADNRESVDLLGMIPSDQVIEIQSSGFIAFALSAFKALHRLRSEGIDTAIDLEIFSRCTMLLSVLSGASVRVGFSAYTNEGLYRADLLTHPVWYNPHLSISHNFMALCESVGSDVSERPLLKRLVGEFSYEVPKFTANSNDTLHIVRLLEERGYRSEGNAPLIVINPDPGLLPLRGWPTNNYAQLAERLHHRFPLASIAVVGLARSKSFAESIGSRVSPERFIDLTGVTRNLRELMVILQRTAIFITNDSGPAHFASLTRTPTVVLFGPETPKLYAPLGEHALSITANLACSPCYSAANHRHSICRDNKCMQAISVEVVEAAVGRILADGGFLQ